MADGLDMFIELQGGSPAVVGETMDFEFKNRKAMEIDSFSMQASTDPSGWESDDLELGQCISPDEPNYVTPAQMLMKKSLQYSIPFTVSKAVDKASPALFLNFARMRSEPNTIFTRGFVSFRKSSGVVPITYLMIEFGQLRLVGYNLSIDSGKDSYPSEKLTFNYKTCKYTYRPQPPEGGTAAPPNIKGFDLYNKVRL